MTDTPVWPSESESARLTTTLFDGVPTSADAIVVAFLRPLVAHLCRRYPRVPLELCESAAEDAIFDVIRHPGRYKPGLLDLGGYLRMAAAGDLENLRQREARQTRGQFPLDSVVEPADRGNTSAGEPDGPSWSDPRLLAEIARLDSAERVAYELWRGGERSTAAFARALGLTHLPPDELAHEVRRVKERVKTRLKRAVGDER